MAMTIFMSFNPRLGPVLLKAGSRRSRHPRASAFTRRGTAQAGESSGVPIWMTCYKCMTLRHYSPRLWHEAAAVGGVSTKSQQARSKSRQRQKGCAGLHSWQQENDAAHAAIAMTWAA